MCYIVAIMRIDVDFTLGGLSAEIWRWHDDEVLFRPSQAE